MSSPSARRVRTWMLAVPAFVLVLLLAACPAQQTVSPTPRATPDATEEPTEEPAEEPTEEPTTAGEMTAEEEELLTHIPESFRDTCVPYAGPGEIADAVAHLDCFPGYPEEVDFTQYASQAAMDEAFDTSIEFSGASEEGDCAAGELGYGPYSIGSEPVGRLLCAEFSGGLVMHWTDERLNIRAVAAPGDNDLEALYEWWTGDSGPNP